MLYVSREGNKNLLQQLTQNLLPISPPITFLQKTLCNFRSQTVLCKMIYKILIPPTMLMVEYSLEITLKL
ncbi:hypothetical protein FGO68_gene4332 [Halteria grandinella]|uniref:Uncharacterized protein n=1 Tax=Halteria grandinella TaxID=5974 RepID=A0A8J8SY45_HALGN|nr:hypothetical protein FGO68_gene4332 [Halteria grandinella]